MFKTSLKISLSPRDHLYIKSLLPHQLRTWVGQVDEIVVVLDLHGYDGDEYQAIIKDLYSFLAEQKVQYPHLRSVTVDYSPAAKAEVSRIYFGKKQVPEKTHRYGP